MYNSGTVTVSLRNFNFAEVGDSGTISGIALDMVYAIATGKNVIIKDFRIGGNDASPVPVSIAPSDSFGYRCCTAFGVFEISLLNNSLTVTALT